MEPTFKVAYDALLKSDRVFLVSFNDRDGEVIFVSTVRPIELIAIMQNIMKFVNEKKIDIDEILDNYLEVKKIENEIDRAVRIINNGN